jgi:hypothetical protein
MDVGMDEAPDRSVVDRKAALMASVRPFHLTQWAQSVRLRYGSCLFERKPGQDRHFPFHRGEVTGLSRGPKQD